MYVLARRKHTKLRRRGNSEYEGTVCACDMNETNHGLTTGSIIMGLLRDV